MTPDNVQNTINIVKLADQLGVADIRVIPSAQYNQPIPELVSLDNEILDRHPILKFRVQNYIAGNHVRGLKSTDSKMCGLVLDDSVIAGQNHYSCVIAFRERAKPIGKVGPNMRQERKEWMMKHNCLNDNICMVNCIDACKFWNLKFREYHPEYF